jgi:rod shape-determining protein MreC
MDSFFIRFKNPLILIAIMVAQIVALAVQVPHSADDLPPGDRADGHKVSLLRFWAVMTVMPFERLTHGSTLSVRHVWEDYIDLRHTRQQNEQLRLEVARLREEQDAFAEDAAQGRRLQALLAFKQQYIATTVAAQVIGTSGTDRSSLVYLDKGAADGLKPEQAVITPDGLVGKVRDVWGHTAQVVLLNDASSGAGVVLSSSRIRGILRGTANGQVVIDDLTSDARIKVGDQVVTSGGDRVFPRGLPVGAIESIAPDPRHQPYTMITIKPNANLLRLEEVLVVTGTQSTLPPEAAQDANTAEAAAAAADASKRAADLVAEKLPSLHNDAPAGAEGAAAQNSVGGVPGIPNSGLPKVQAPVHADQYSPGATPSASDLRPGAPSNAQPESPKTDPPKL